MELHLLRSCLNVCKINHLLRTVPPEIILNQLGKFDENIRSTLAGIIHSPIPDDAWSQAVLSFSYRGLGLGEATKIAPAAFTASCTMVRSLVVELLPNLPTDDFIFPWESSSKKMLFDVIAQNKALLPDQLTQSTLRHVLDSLSFDHLLSHSDIRNQVRLNALSASRETSAWLKAIPIASLGLDILGSEFNIALQIWLGIPLIPSLICPCTQFIDQYGDHLLGCSCGPYRIRKHDALRDVIYHALKLDNLRLNYELMVTQTPDPVTYTIQTLTMGSHLFLIFLSPMYCNLAQYLPLLMLVQSLRVEKFPKTINIVQ